MNSKDECIDQMSKHNHNKALDESRRVVLFG